MARGRITLRLLAAILLSTGALVVGGHTTRASFDPGPARAPDGELVRDAWLNHHGPNGGPAIFTSTQPGDGPTQLAAITAQYPQITSLLSPEELQRLASVRIGTASSLALIYAEPASLSLTSGGGGCGDPNVCDYYQIVFNNVSTFNGYNTYMYEYRDAYRDDGSTTQWTWHYADYNGQDGPTGPYHNWNPVSWSGTFSRSLGGNTWDYYTNANGHGSWSVVNFCLCWPPVSAVIYDNMMGDGCANELNTFPGGGTSTVTEYFYQQATAWDAGDNVIGYGASGFQTC